MDSKSIQCGFESHRGHITDLQVPNVIGRRLLVEATFALTLVRLREHDAASGLEPRGPHSCPILSAWTRALAQRAPRGDQPRVSGPAVAAPRSTHGSLAP